MLVLFVVSILTLVIVDGTGMLMGKDVRLWQTEHSYLP